MASYHGGKQKSGLKIANIITKYAKKHNIKGYWEPFCGMMGVYQHVIPLFEKNEIDVKYQASDKHKSLIQMWKSLQNGWNPPKSITKEKYETLKKKKTASALKGYVGFTFSFGGIYYLGFRGDYGKKRKTVSKPNTESKMKKLGTKFSNVTFKNGSYNTINKNIKDYIIYCDPPYQIAQNNLYYGEDMKMFKFNWDKFWKWAEKMSKNNIVIVTEYSAPKSFVAIHNFNTNNKVGQGHLQREKLFIHKRYL